jgi:hypothetical protein
MTVPIEPPTAAVYPCVFGSLLEKSYYRPVTPGNTSPYISVIILMAEKKTLEMPVNIG